MVSRIWKLLKKPTTPQPLWQSLLWNSSSTFILLLLVKHWHWLLWL
jgi:hypothetical protein